MQLIAYYFRAQMYTCVPKQIEEDIQWMADHGTNAVAIAVLEQDLFAARENIDFIADAAAKRGMELYVVPSRWGGLVAGSPKVPSIFAASRPDTWAKKEDGSDKLFFGGQCSIYHPDVFSFFTEKLDELFASWDVQGIIWDEPKCLDRDYSKHATANNLSEHWQAAADFFDRLGAHIKQRRPTCQRQLFAYGHLVDQPELLNTLATIPNLDAFGLDGRPFQLGANPDGREENRKSLLDQGPGFIAAAQAAGKQSFFLVENHNVSAAALPFIETGMPQTLALQPDVLTYYYYPRAVEKPEETMQAIGQALVTYQNGTKQ